MQYNIVRHHHFDSSVWSITRRLMMMRFNMAADDGCETNVSSVHIQMRKEEHAFSSTVFQNYFDHLHNRHSRYIPIPVLFPPYHVLFRGLGDRDGKERSLKAVKDLFMYGLCAADLTEANPIGQTCSKAGQVLMSDDLSTACRYLSNGFGDGGLVAIESDWVNKAILMGECRFEKEAQLQIAVFSQVPLNAVAAVFLPSVYEADLRRLHASATHTQGFEHMEFGDGMTPDQRTIIHQNLQSLFERVHFYSDAHFSSLESIVRSVLQRQGRQLTTVSSLVAMMNQAVANEDMWVANTQQTVATDLKGWLQPLFPSLSDTDNWLRAGFERLPDDRFTLFSRLVLPLMPVTVRLLDMVTVRQYVSLRSFWAEMRVRGGFGIFGQDQRDAIRSNLIQGESTQPSALAMVKKMLSKSCIITDGAPSGQIRLLTRALLLVSPIPEVRCLEKSDALMTASHALEATLNLGAETLCNAAREYARLLRVIRQPETHVQDASCICTLLNWPAVWRVLWARIACTSLGAEAELQQLRSQLEEAETTSEACESLTRQLIYHARAHVWPESMDLG